VTSTSPASPADTADTSRCSRSTIAACYVRPMPENSAAGRPSVAGASAGSVDAGACSARAAARIAGSDDGFDSDGAAAAGSGNSDPPAASRCPSDAAARTDREAFAPASLDPGTINIC